MSDPQFERVRRVFLAVRDLDDAARHGALDRECGSDAALRAEIESLLSHHDAERIRPTTPVVDDVVQAILDTDAPPDDTLPRAFGPFELLEVIGRGGMGTVYRARQRTPDRVVALKVIRTGMMTPSMLQRFRYEADVLARLQHPGIASIFEAGTVKADGLEQPYFAMELVAGLPLDRYAHARHLDTRGRLEMLVRICEAVHHAHQKGVIHRDLKPGNILVDESGQPKILDFGVARAVDADGRATTLRTHAGQLIGTLPYMSPEQVSGDPQRLDVRSDVYALGVLAFELLTGRLPHDLDRKSIPDAALTIRSADPARLSAVAPTLRGDLETIVGKALEKDPARRYESAAALADDLRRFLAHQPIVARPPSVSYQLALFARRHRALVTGGALAALALLVATALSVGFAVNANRTAQREIKQREIAERTNDHLINLLRLPDPHGRGMDVTVGEMLDLVVERLDDGQELPEVELEVRSAIGTTFLNQRQNRRALAQLERAVQLQRSIDPESPRLPRLLIAIGSALVSLDRSAEAEAAYREAFELADRIGAPGVEEAGAALLEMLVSRAAHAEAEPLARRQLQTSRQRDAPLSTIGALRRLARIQTALDRHDDALQSMIEANDLSLRHLPESHPLFGPILIELGHARLAAGDRDAALEVSRRGLEIAHRHRPIGASEWAWCLFQHVKLLEAADHRDEAAAALTDARATVAAAVGPDHRHVRLLTDRLAALYERGGQSELAQEARAWHLDAAPDQDERPLPQSGLGVPRE